MKIDRIPSGFFVLMLTSFSFHTKAEITFQVKRVSQRVYIAHPNQLARVNATSVILVGDSFLTVIESQPDIYQAEILLQAIRKNISTLPIRYLIVTHFHLDHILGINSFLKENKNLIVISHENVLHHIRESSSKEKIEWLSVIQSVAFPMSHTDSYYDEMMKYYEDVCKSPIEEPNLTFSDSLTIHDKGLDFKMTRLGWAHTNGDIIVHVPQENLLIVGDILHDYEPLFMDANPEEWIQVLTRLERFNVDFIVGGHGDIQQGKQVLRQWRAYMLEIMTMTKSAIQTGKSLDDFLSETEISAIKSLQDNNYGDRIQSFRLWYMSVLTSPLEDVVQGNLRSLWNYYTNQKK